MLELFVNNEKTLLKMYEILFPHRAGPNAGQGVSQTMIEMTGAGTFGQSAIEALKKSAGGSRRGTSESTNANLSMRVSAQNNMMLNHIAPSQYPADFDYEMVRQGILQQQMQFPHIMAKKQYQNPLAPNGSKGNMMVYDQLPHASNMPRHQTAEPGYGRVRNLPPMENQQMTHMT